MPVSGVQQSESAIQIHIKDGLFRKDLWRPRKAQFPWGQERGEQGCKGSRYKGDGVGFRFQISTHLCTAGKEPREKEKVEL